MMPVSGRITAPFNQMRPLSSEVKTHIHGAIDIAAPIGSPIVAPEDGTKWGWIGIRSVEGKIWPSKPQIDGEIFPYANYFYDMYGGVIILKAKDRTHVITHSYANQIINIAGAGKITFVEEARQVRFPVFGMYTERRNVRAGEIIGYVGNAGFSTGSHIHWEIHNGYKWNEHARRIDPETWRV